ncbi:hypothetical protein [Halioxenophilus sp. WMMB6]|uniref:hypothetical protein n=1 Tax=Halioxenophilus sp. WMMB6 TaxID=3073815 RepID=UPI00295E4270|nr:hypothetical protein [Halioxenophilus sp. WMMB6]
MDPDKIAQIRAVIASGKSAQRDSTGLEFWYLERSARLHHLIELPPGNEAEALRLFVERYIDFLPDCLEHFHALAERANISQYTGLFLDLAIDFLLSQPEGVELHSYGHLIDEAYMAHRLLEELNDRCLRYLGGPAMPADTAFANLIMHSIIGEAYANELDMAVQYAIEANGELEKNVLSGLQPAPLHELADAAQNWPVFGEDLSVGVKFHY